MAEPSVAAAGRVRGGHPRAGGGWPLAAALAITQTVGYGVLYYAFPVLLQPMAADLHASTAAVTGALTASLLAGGVMAVPVGRWLDRHGGRALMTTGSIAATALVLAWSQVHSITQLYLILIGIGFTSAMVLYEPALAVVVSRFQPHQRANAVLAVIVVAGFASTIFMPLVAALLDQYGWRTTLLVLAVAHGAITVPLHALAVRKPPRPATPRPQLRSTPVERAAVVRAALRDGRFWWLATAFVAHGAAMAAMTVHLVGFLIHKGHSATFAATIAGLLGVLSVAGRLFLTVIQRRRGLTTTVAAICTIQALATATLLFVGGSRIGAAAAVVAFGIGFGLASLVKPALLADRYDTAAYATIAGVLTVPTTLAKATAPLAAAGLLGIGGYPLVLAAIAATCLTAATGITMRATSPRPTPSPPTVGTTAGPSRPSHHNTAHTHVRR